MTRIWRKRYRFFASSLDAIRTSRSPTQHRKWRQGIGSSQVVVFACHAAKKSRSDIQVFDGKKGAIEGAHSES